MAEHTQLTANLHLTLYFCHALSPWERATSESQNDRLRHHPPRETPNPFDVVLLDLTVAQGKEGAATLVELLQIEPAVRAVVMSGYANDQTFEEWQRARFVGALSKPFAPRRLRTRSRRPWPP
jgi:CheY-like chemotaxis protein